MLSKSLLLVALAAEGALAFPFVAHTPGVDSSLLPKRQQTPNPNDPGSLKNCPVNPNHVPAAPVTAEYPYNNAKNGQKGNQKGGFMVPHPGDKAHRFIAPDYSKDIRGPCPGLNTLANHGFLARDGITTFDELVDAQQNVYNVGFDLAQLLAVLGLTTTDGDIVTEKLSIGCDATPRTSFNPKLTGTEPGLDGHNKFEADTSLTRSDFFITNPRGNNFAFNSTLFEMMTKTTGGLYNFKNLALYRKQRYEQSIQENPNFYFGPLSLLLYGAASFLYELMPSGTRNYKPDYYTISHFFGAAKSPGGGYHFTGHERLPDNWVNRVAPYDNSAVGSQIFEMYGAHPVLFGGNTADGSFDVISTGNGIKNGKLVVPNATSMTCLLLQLSTERLPTSLDGVVTPTLQTIEFALSKLKPSFKNFGCPIPLT